MANHSNPNHIHIRIMARPGHVEATAARLRAAFDVVSESKDFPNRVTNAWDDRVRRYLVIENDCSMEGLDNED